MDMVSKSFSGVCPETGKTQTIEVRFKKISMVGNPTPYYVASNFRCEHYIENTCANCGEGGQDCPLLKAAEQKMNN